MKTNKLTEASMFSALFVVISVIALSTGIGYSTYLVVGVPIVSALIYFKCDFKYTVMSLISALIIIATIFGDLSTAVFMFQGIIIGLICAYFLNGKMNIYDSLIFCSIISCIFMILIDISFSNLVGVSFMQEFRRDVDIIPVSEVFRDALYYIFCISLPIGTVLCTILGSLLFGKKLNFLNNNSMNKYKIISNLKMYVSYLSCSGKVIKYSTLFLLMLEILDYFKISSNILYFNTIINMVRYIMLYFVIEDCFGFIFKFVYDKFKSKLAVNLVQIAACILLVYNLKVTSIALIIFNFLINKKFKLRDRQTFVLDSILRKGKMAKV